MKSILMLCVIGLTILYSNTANAALKLNYSFNSTDGHTIVDETSNGYDAQLMGNAKIKQLGNFKILEIGATNGYVDMGANTGNLIKNLSDFTISTYLYIDPATVLTNNGNFVWTFSNTDNILAAPIGCAFYSAKSSRFAICPTNYKTETAVNLGSEAAKGGWQHITYRQVGTIGEIYINGQLRKSGTVNMLLKDLGATSFNYLARSAYAGDQYLLNSKMCDFRIYDTTITQSEITSLAGNIAKLDTLTFGDIVDSVKMKLSLGDLSGVISNLDLPITAEGGVVISWNSSTKSTVSNQGVVNRPVAGSSNVNLTLTATITKDFISKTKVFNVTVLAQLDNITSVQIASDSLLLTGNINNLRSNLVLPTSGKEGTTITWSSDKTTLLNNFGAIVNRPANGTGKQKVVMTATITKGTTSIQKAIDVYVAEDEGFAAYLFAYFTGNNISQEAIRFALSDNGLVYKALNSDQPIISSAAISLTGGVRDPHILRGENGMYYMVVTDMVSANGWNSNRGMVLLKSNNLTDWQTSTIHIPTAYPSEFANVDRVWAPQTIYDASVGKYMIYFSMHLGSGDYDKVYYAYANSDFTALESTPKLLFANPAATAVIDADIIENNGKFHMFFKTEGSGNGIKKAVSDKLTEGWVINDKYLDQNSNAVEGGCVFRMYNTDKYILMYDVYSSGYYEFTESYDLENFSVINGNSFDFTPRHGTIIPITQAEKNALNNKWGNSTDISKNEIENTLIYPNPVHDELKINLGNRKFNKSTICIYDFKGSKIMERNAEKTIETLNVSGLTPGIYIIQLLENNKLVKYSKFIVQ